MLLYVYIIRSNPKNIGFGTEQIFSKNNYGYKPFLKLVTIQWDILGGHILSSLNNDRDEIEGAVLSPPFDKLDKHPRPSRPSLPKSKNIYGFRRTVYLTGEKWIHMNRVEVQFRSYDRLFDLFRLFGRLSFESDFDFLCFFDFFGFFELFLFRSGLSESLSE